MVLCGFIWMRFSCRTVLENGAAFLIRYSVCQPLEGGSTSPMRRRPLIHYKYILHIGQHAYAINEFTTKLSLYTRHYCYWFSIVLQVVVDNCLKKTQLFNFNANLFYDRYSSLPIKSSAFITRSQFFTILHSALRWWWENLSQTLGSPDTSHTSLSRTSCGVSFVGVLEKIDRVITASPCIWICAKQTWWLRLWHRLIDTEL